MKGENPKRRTPLGEFIIQRMTELQLRQSDVARLSEISPSGIGKLIHGAIPKPQNHSHVVERLARALEVSTEELAKFFGGSKSAKIAGINPFASGKVMVLLQAIETVSGKPAVEVLDEDQQLEKFLKGILRRLLNKEGEGEV